MNQIIQKRHSFIKGTLILTAAGLVSRVLGFFFRIFLSHTFGEEQVGLYQLTFPVYMLCLSISTFGLETAISRSVSHFSALGRAQDAKKIFHTGLLVSVLLSIFCMFLMQKHSLFLSERFLGDSRCASLLFLMALALPAASVHSCICGYSYGLQNTATPAISQLFEQTIRILSVFVLFYLLSSYGSTTGILLAVIGLILGEYGAAIFSIFLLRKNGRFFRTSSAASPSFTESASSPRPLSLRCCCSELFRLSIPLTANRTALTFLQSIEAASIPVCLQLYGYSSPEALRLYGVLTGMALPCILFPSALTNSVSLLLMPAVAQKQAESSSAGALQLVRKAVFSCFLLGCVSSLFFLLFGSLLGNLLFHSALAGRFILTLAWICPFLYCNSALLSTLNGFGLTSLTFLTNLSGLFIRILGVYYGIVNWGIQGYLWALFISQLTISLLALLALNRQMKKGAEPAC